MVISFLVVFLQLTAFRWHGESYVTPSDPQIGDDSSGQKRGHSGTTTASSPSIFQTVLCLDVEEINFLQLTCSSTDSLNLFKSLGQTIDGLQFAET